MKPIFFLILAILLSVASLAYAKFGMDLSLSLGAGGTEVTGPVPSLGHFILIDNSGHYLLIDGSSHKLKIDGAS